MIRSVTIYKTPEGLRCTLEGTQLTKEQRQGLLLPQDALLGLVDMMQEQPLVPFAGNLYSEDEAAALRGAMGVANRARGGDPSGIEMDPRYSDAYKQTRDLLRRRES